MLDYSIILPTYRRPDNFKDHIEHLLDLRPEPEKILITHVQNDEWSDQFDFQTELNREKIEGLFFTDGDPGLIETKFTPAWSDLIPTNFVLTVDDDIFPGHRYPEAVIKSYMKLPGIYGGMGFIYGENKFNKKVYGGWRGFPNDDYIHTNEITRVDSPGQTYFFNTNDFPEVNNDVLPDHFCDFCSDDLQLAWWANLQNDVESFVAPEPEDYPELWPVKDLRERHVPTQSLVGSNHNDEDHKNELVEWIQDNNYTRVENR